MNNNKYTVHELVHEQSFRKMVNGTANADEVSRWSCWIEADDANRKIAKEAITEIGGFEFRDPHDSGFEKEWERLHHITIGAKNLKLPENHKKKSVLKWIYRVAAVLVLGVLVGAGIHMYSKSSRFTLQLKKITRQQTIETGPNERKTITFSDGSKVILNSSSALTYKTGMVQGQTIEVALKGEAYFDAESGDTRRNRVFMVLTPDGIIRDIGTKFLVTVKKQYSRVVLQEGKVVVHPKERRTDEDIKLTEGQLLSFDQSRVLSQKMVNSTFYTSWATGFMQFNHTTIQKFAGYVEQRFNVVVKIVDPKLKDIKIDGSIYFNSLEGLVRSVTKVAKIPAYQSKDRKIVYIGNKSRNINNQQ